MPGEALLGRDLHPLGTHPLGTREERRGERPAPLIALAVPGAHTGRVLAALAPALAAGRRLYCLDGGNTFNPYRLAAWARRRGGDPAALLERVFVSRAYTCHQLAAAVETMLDPLIEGAPGGRPPPLAAILGIERLFEDEDIALFERRHLFDRILTRARRLSRGGLALMITCGAPRGEWARRLARVAPLGADPARAARGMGRELADGPHTGDV